MGWVEIWLSGMAVIDYGRFVLLRLKIIRIGWVVGGIRGRPE